MTLQSCNNDDDSTSLDPIIGTWKLTSETENGLEKITDYDKNSTINFSEDGILTTNLFSEDQNGECEEDGGFTEEDVVTWVNVGDSFYTIDDGDTDTLEFVFSNNDDTFTLTDTDIEDDGETSVIVSVYTKQ